MQVISAGGQVLVLCSNAGGCWRVRMVCDVRLEVGGLTEC